MPLFSKIGLVGNKYLITIVQLGEFSIGHVLLLLFAIICKHIINTLTH